MTIELDHELIAHLDRLVFSNNELHHQITSALADLELMLNDSQKDLPHACKEMDIETFKLQLPEHLRAQINLCRISIQKPGQAKLEKHCNSTQYLVSLKNKGIMHVAESEITDMTFLKFEISGPNLGKSVELLDRWNIVQPNTWHFPEASSDGDWCTIVFFSASSADIIEEYWTGDFALQI